MEQGVDILDLNVRRKKKQRFIKEILFRLKI